MNEEILYIINSLYDTYYNNEKNKESFDKDALELHILFKDYYEKIQVIKKDEIVNKVIDIFDKNDVKKISKIYIISSVSKKEIFKIQING